MPMILLSTGALFTVGLFAARWVRRPRWQGLLIAGFALLATPTLLFPAYFLHLAALDVPWYYEWRSHEWTDFVPTSCGLLFGALAGLMQPRPSPMVEATSARWDWRWVRMSALLLLLVLLVSFAKPWLFGVQFSALQERWRDGVCLQSTPSTCGPCSAATALRTLGSDITEKELAVEARSSRTGTLNWLLARAIRKRGFQVDFVQPASLEEVTAPAVVGVVLPGGAGHFVTWLGKRDGLFLIGDPLEGRLELRQDQLDRRYRFAPFAMQIRL